MMVILILLIISVIFNALGTIGLHRFPDVYTRLHAATKCTTFGTIFMTFTVMAYSIRRYVIMTDGTKFLNMAIHTFVALIALLITNPTGAHAIARAAHKMGIKPEKAVKDDLEDKESEVS
ncbi:MAG: monovalent cation/H(+) antiporter subunit G [Candidatus Thermoplasmatota archaeon]|nr:monovalent cation/H(+) antiporter subunit G [Candidatus Thermoplasmatota archaeon]MBS3789360.1 monovalent cation/H(+) antiporter subunit G [Candidatus Thermoplasmatota archaeon]